MALKIGRSIQSRFKKVLGPPEALDRFEQPGGCSLPPQQKEGGLLAPEGGSGF